MKRVTETNFTARVYQYGAVPIDTFPEEGVQELLRANKLWNNLVEFNRDHRKAYDQARSDADAEYASLLESLEKLNQKIDSAYDNKRNARMKAGTKDAAHPLIEKANAKIRDLKTKKKELWEPLKKARKNADKKIDKKAFNDSFRVETNKLQRVENTDGLNSCTANLVADYFLTARDRTFKDPKAKLQRHRFYGTGFFYYRFRRKKSNIDGVNFNDLFIENENDQRPFVFLSADKSRSKPRLRLRIKVAGGAKASGKTYMQFDVILHRPAPESAQIQNGKVVRKRVGDKFSYTVSFTMRIPENGTARLKKRAIGIDIGFRQSGKKIRAAAIASSDPEDPVEYIYVSQTFLKRIEHIDALKSKLDENANALSKIIKPLLNKGSVLHEEHKKYKFVKKIADFPLNRNFPFELAYKLSSWVVKHGKGELPVEVEQEAVKWWKKNSLAYREHHNLRNKAYLERKAQYRDIASGLVKKKQPIGIEQIDLSVFAETKDKDNKLGNIARANRFLVAPSELLNAVKNAGQREGIPVLEVRAKNTSKTCSSCGHIHKELGAESNWTCPGCKVEHDRDHNVAINIARKAEEELKKIDEKTK